jgi:hypothetical protein
VIGVDEVGADVEQVVLHAAQQLGELRGRRPEGQARPSTLLASSTSA